MGVGRPGNPPNNPHPPSPISQISPMSHQLTESQALRAAFRIGILMETALQQVLIRGGVGSVGEVGSVDEALDELMQQRGQKERLDLLTTLVMQGVEVDEQAAVVVAAAWGRIERDELWRARYDSIRQLQESVEFDRVVQPLVKKGEKTEREKVYYERQIMSRWSVSALQQLPRELTPARWSH